MLDSWNACVRGVHHHNYRRGGRINSPSGDISPIRTSPMIEEDEEKDLLQNTSSELFLINSNNDKYKSPIKKQTEIIASQQQHLIDDDKDFRAIDAANSNTIESNSPSPLQRKNSPRQQCSDDNDFRRSSIQPQQSQFTRQSPPPYGLSDGQSFEGNIRR